MFMIVQKSPPGGLANVDKPFITHFTGKGTDRRSPQARPHLLQSEASCKAPQTKASRVLIAQTCTELHYISVHVQKTKVKKRSRNKKLLPKGDKEGVTVHSQNNTHSFSPVAPWPALITGGERAMY